MKFKGFDDWIEIFEGGTQIDSKGRSHDGDAVIDLALKTFDPSYHEPPLTKGHPEHDAPSFGWVNDLKKGTHNGINTLLMKTKDVVSDFEDMVKTGRYKKRSASFYPDGRLRHVGFFGAIPPAVKGLADLSFSDNDDAIVFDFSDTNPWTWNTIAGIFRKMREWFIEKEGKETADSIIPDWDIEAMKDAEKNATSEAGIQPEFREHKTDPPGQRRASKKEEKIMTFTEFMEMFKFWKEAEKNPDMQLPNTEGKGAGDGDKTFSEADIKTAGEEAAKAEREKVETEFAEKDRAAKRAARTSEITAFCEGLVKEGKLTPGLIKYGVPEILSFMASHDDVIEFGESKEKATMYDRFKGLFETELPKLINFGEIAKRDNTAAGGNAAEKLEGLIRKKRETNKDLSYSAAFSEVQKENPDLATEYQQELAE